MKTCPYCDEKIQETATACAYCGRDLVPAFARAAGAGIAAFLSLVIPGAGQMYAQSVRVGIVWLVLTIVCYIVFVPLGLLAHIVCVLIAATAGGEERPVVRGARTESATPVGGVMPLGRVHTVGPVLFIVIALELMIGLSWLVAN